MHCASFSRCLASGYRIAWAAARRYAPSVQWLTTMGSIAASLPPQLAIAEYLALDGYDSNLLGLREALSRRRQHALRMVERHFPAGIRVTRPQSGYFLWVELPIDVVTLALHRTVLDDHCISIAPGALFSADRRFAHHMRLNVSISANNSQRFDDALRVLGRLAAAGPALSR